MVEIITNLTRSCALAGATSNGNKNATSADVQRRWRPRRDANRRTGPASNFAFFLISSAWCLPTFVAACSGRGQAASIAFNCSPRSLPL